VVDADAGEIPGGDPRSGDCSCHSPKQGLPCWPYEGFRRPEPRSGRSGGNTSQSVTNVASKQTITTRVMNTARVYSIRRNMVVAGGPISRYA
jgi:hypothetical protein